MRGITTFLGILILTLSATKSLYSQHIIAGVHGAGDYYYNFAPDENIYAVSSLFYDSDTLFIDVNDDSIADFIISAVCDGLGHWHHFEYCSITPLNGNMISVSDYDSCFANCPADSFLFTIPMVEPISLNDTIDHNDTWIDSSGYLNLSGYDCCFPNGCGYECSAVNFSTQEKFIGIRVNVIDTSYFGWIRINYTANDSMVIGDFACNYFVLGLESYTADLDFTIYPNPVSSDLTIQFNKLHNPINLIIHNLYGQFVRQISSISNTSLTIDCNELPNGIYFINVSGIGSASFTTKKIIVNR